MASIVLDIEVKSIDSNVLERTRENLADIVIVETNVVDRVTIVGTKGIPQEVGKPFSNRIRQGNGTGSVTTDREQDLLSHSLADRNILPDLVTSREQGGTGEE